jgi:hypothetical protein
VSSGVIIFFELTLVLGLALVFGVRELRNLRRYDRERAARNLEAANRSASPSETRHPEG